MTTRVCRLYGAHDLRVETEPTPALRDGEALIALGAGGICGSDLHYYHDGGIGRIRVREPIIVGHEAAGRVLATAQGVDHLTVGDLVAINPSLPCGHCADCGRGAFNHCAQMRFMGSAYRTPHEQGMFRDRLAIPAVRAHRFANAIPMTQAACAEPLAVCLHAAKLAPTISGARILVTGAGPIGALMTAVIARRSPADLIVTDLHPHPLDVARAMGAKTTINVLEEAGQLEALKADRGQIDLVFECTGAAAAIADALQMLRPQGAMVMVGVAGDTPLPLNMIVSKEIQLFGSHRFHSEFADAVRAIDDGAIDVSPIISPSFDCDDAVEAFAVAGDRRRSVKTHLTFGLDERSETRSN